MTTKHLYFACLVLIGFSACNNSGSAPATNGADSTVTTTTTTTTVRHAYPGSFVPQPTTKYIVLNTKKEVTVRIDTVQGDIVNAESNEPVDLFVEPMTHDTISGITGTVVNNYIIHDSAGDFRLDTERYNASMNSPQSEDEVGKVKYKEKANGKSKYKDDEEKVKEKNGVQETITR